MSGVWHAASAGRVRAPTIPLAPASLALACQQGKLDTEELLRKSGVNFTSIRPVYIYGPLNYNPVEVGDGGCGMKREQW